MEFKACQNGKLHEITKNILSRSWSHNLSAAEAQLVVWAVNWWLKSWWFKFQLQLSVKRSGEQGEQSRTKNKKSYFELEQRKIAWHGKTNKQSKKKNTYTTRLYRVSWFRVCVDFWLISSVHHFSTSRSSVSQNALGFTFSAFFLKKERTFDKLPPPASNTVSCQGSYPSRKCTFK